MLIYLALALVSLHDSEKYRDSLASLMGFFVLCVAVHNIYSYGK